MGLACNISNVSVALQDDDSSALMHALEMSCHDTRGSNCSLVQADSERMSLTPLICPTRFPKVRCCAPSMPRHQRGLVARLMKLASVGLGGAVRPV